MQGVPREGFKQANRKLKVNIPAGVGDGNRLRLAGEGQPSASGGPAGDLYVFLKVKERPFFERHEAICIAAFRLRLRQARSGRWGSRWCRSSVGSKER